MARSMTAEAGRLAFGDLATGDSPGGFEQFKLDRLRELRAVIDSLRAEDGTAPLRDARSSQDHCLTA
jgi:hypothetical protein